MSDTNTPTYLQVVNVTSGCTAAVRWASLTMDFVGRPIPAHYKETYLYGTHFAVCSCPHEYKEYCEYGHLPHQEGWEERNARNMVKRSTGDEEE